MKLLSAYIAVDLHNHDSSITYFDGQNVNFYNHERSTQIKHNAIRSIEEMEKIIFDVWDVTLQEIDKIAVICTSKKYVNIHPLFKQKNVTLVDHHLAHYYSAKLLNPTATKGIVIDGGGEDNVWWSIYDNDVLVNQGLFSETKGSFGDLLETYADQVCGISPPAYSTVSNWPDIAGKLMGLQSYGKIHPPTLEFLQNCVTSRKYLGRGFELMNTKETQENKIDVAHTMHLHLEQILLDMFNEFFDSNDEICYSGGTAQNVIWNTALRKYFPKIFIPPHCGDTGLSLGGIEYIRSLNNLEPFNLDGFPFITYDVCPNVCPSLDTIRKTARLLANNKIVAFYQGNGEIGQRALGNRSILLNPMIENGKDMVNTIKHREYYRPFGAVVLDEYKTEYFNVDESFENQYMLYVAKTKNKDNLPAVTHVDGTCRIQTLSHQNPILRALIEEFHKLTSCPVLLNTSLNIAGRPIASYPEAVYDLIFYSKLDYAVIGNKTCGF